MKDLITSVGSIMILMVFVMQFCSNQVLASKILLVDTIIDGYQEEMTKAGNNTDKYRQRLAECLGCGPEEIKFYKTQDKLTIDMPIKNVVACGKFLGITEEQNQSTYTREMLLK